MKKMPRIILKFLLLGAIVFSASHLLAQDKPLSAGEQEATNVAPEDDTSSGLTVESVQAALDALEKNSGLEAAIKDLLRPKYNEAIAALKAAKDDAAKAKQYQEAISTAPEQTTTLTANLEKLPSVEQVESQATDQAKGLSSNDIQELLDSQRNAVAQLTDDLATITAEQTRVKGRPAEINVRLPKAESELSETGKKLAPPELTPDSTSPGRIADRLVLQARESRLRSELELLKQEQLSESARENILRAQESLLTRQLANATAALRVLDAAKNLTLKTEARNIGTDIQTILQDVPADDLAARELANEIQEIATQLDDTVQKLKLISEAQKQITARLGRLTEENQYITAQLQLGGGGDVIAQLLFEMRNRILRRGDNEDFTKQLPKLDEARLAELECFQKIRRQGEVEKIFADRSTAETEKLLNLRAEVLAKLGSQEKAVVSRLSELQGDNERYITMADTVLAFVNEQLFWIKSFPPITTATMAKLPGGVTWVFEREHWIAIWRAQSNMAQRAPVRFYGFLFLVGLLLVLRGRIIAALTQTGVVIRRISTDQFRLTVQALLWTLLLAAPLPLLFAFLWWTLTPATMTSDWLRGVVDGVGIAVWLTLLIGFVVAACRPAGLGIAHFGWTEPQPKRLRNAIFAFAIVYVPALLLTFSTLFGANATPYGENIGRLSFILAQVWALIVLWRFFGSADGVLADLMLRQPDALITRTRFIWFALVLGFPVAFIVLAWHGYVITAIELSVGLLATLGIVACGAFLYWMAVRWFAVKKRKLALAEAQEKRRARKAAAEAIEKTESGEIVSVDSDVDLVLDLDLISDQTRHLLRMVISLCVVVTVALYWSETIPIFSALERFDLPLIGLSLLSVAKAVLIVVVTWIAVQNLPGLIELSVLRTTSIETGTRYAIVRLCQYILTAIGLFLLFGVLQIDWTKFGWIAAALSVGLGFGLQEVVANFVCGLILLFERPVRVGDVVTLDNMTGTVTKIQMRATTITNWDRQEFVVPNKNLITGTILNWTLSAATNRIVIPVGVAYGTDTEKVREILLGVATDHPLILGEPQPSTSFEAFADSSLTIILRAYLPDLDNRLKTISELHTEINRRFSAEGIEIAYPQVDLHFRNTLESNLYPEGQVFRS